MNNSKHKHKDDKKSKGYAKNIFRLTNPRLKQVKKIIPTSNLGYKFKGDNKITGEFTNSRNNSVDYSRYLNQIPQLIDIGYNQKWLDAVAGDKSVDIKSAITYLIKNKNDIIELNKDGIDSGKMMRVYKSQYPYVTTGLLAKNIDILKNITIKNRNIFLDKVLKSRTIDEIENYFKKLNQKCARRIEDNSGFKLYEEHDDKEPLLPNSKDPVLTQAAFVTKEISKNTPSLNYRKNKSFYY